MHDADDVLTMDFILLLDGWFGCPFLGLLLLNPHACSRPWRALAPFLPLPTTLLPPLLNTTQGHLASKALSCIGTVVYSTVRTVKLVFREAVILENRSCSAKSQLLVDSHVAVN